MLSNTQHNDASLGSNKTTLSRVQSTQNRLNYQNIIEKNYHWRNKTSQPGLVSLQVHVVMRHTKPGRWQQNLCFVSSAATFGILFQAVCHTYDLFLQSLVHQVLGDAQVFHSPLQWQYPILQIYHLWVGRVLLQKEII